ncbi:MAG: D-alanyl-D-alanine carboxypeptidase/D-alanyl-D-alanine-endopeptidase [Gloeomargarita sp. HHBFW_bins_162]
MLIANPPTPVELCRTTLTTALDQIRQKPEYQKAHWGILIQTQTNPPRTLYEHQSQQFFIPASTTKLLTTAGALMQLGADYRFRTAFYQQGRQLHLIGQGDPTLTTLKLQQLAQKITPAQRQTFDTVVIQTGFFQGSTFNDQWEWQDILSTDIVPINSLILNRNESQLRLIAQTVGKPARVVWTDPQAGRYWQIMNNTRSTNNPLQPIHIWIPPGLPQLHLRGDVTRQPVSFTVPILDTDQYLIQTIARLFPNKNVTVQRTVPPADLGTAVAAVESVPVLNLVTQINQVSDNLYAEALLRHLGAVSNPKIPSDWAGIQAIQKLLTGMGVTPGGILQSDGSGLSRHNRVTPLALVQVLQGMANSPWGASYANSLAAPGQPGTLRRRYTQTDINLQAKTGTLSGVAALAGYLRPRNRPGIVFAVMVNQSEQPAGVLRRGIDQMVMTVNDWAEQLPLEQWDMCIQTRHRGETVWAAQRS